MWWFAGARRVVVVLVSVAGLILGLAGPPFVVRAGAADTARTGREASAAAAQSEATPPAGGEYVPVSAARLVDTRYGTGGLSSPLGAGQTVSFKVLGAGGVPSSGVSTVVLNVTGTAASALTFLTAFPAGQARPATASLNVTAGGTASNLAFVPVGSNGQVSVYNNLGSTDLVVDVEGYVTDSTATTGASTFASTTLTSIADTRSGVGVPKGKLGAGQTVELTVGGVAGVPSSGVTAVVLNVTAVLPSALTYLTVWQAGAARPTDAAVTSSGSITLQLPDLHGNIGATAPDDPGAGGVTATYAYTEYGTPEAGNTPPTEYGMLGAKQRSTKDLGGLTLMGQRLYNPQTGRFLQTDPVPGGSANRYDYCTADPTNCFDQTGRYSYFIGVHLSAEHIRSLYEHRGNGEEINFVADLLSGLGGHLGGIAAHVLRVSEAFQEALIVHIAEAYSHHQGLRIGVTIEARHWWDRPHVYFTVY